MSDLKISQLTSIDNSTITTSDVIPIVNGGSTKNISYLNLMNPKDTTFAIVDDADLTKKVNFQLSGITTGNTRTLTIPDASTTIAGTDTTQTITNKTIGSGTKINISGTDGTGAIYYRDASGNFINLPIGSTSQILSVVAGIPAWIANPAISDSSYTTKGAVQFLTDAATSGITVTAGIANVNTGTGANQIVKLNSSSQLPAVDGSLLTGTGGFLTSGAPGTVTSNASATVLTYSLAGGVLGTNKGVRIRVSVTIGVTSTNNGVSYTIQYGGTAIGSLSASGISGTPTFTCSQVVDILLMGSGATGTQHSNQMLMSVLTSGGGGNGTSYAPSVFTSAIDSTIAQNITIVASSAASTTGTLVDYFIQKIA